MVSLYGGDSGLFTRVVYVEYVGVFWVVFIRFCMGMVVGLCVSRRLEFFYGVMFFLLS